MTFRCGTHAGHTYVYAVNDAPFGATAWARLDAPAGCRIEEELSGRRQGVRLHKDARGTYLEVRLDPYDLLAVRLSAPGVRLLQPEVSLPPVVKTELGQQILELGARAARLRNPTPLTVLANPGFEQPVDEGGRLPGWATTQQRGVSIEVDDTVRHRGKRSVRMTTNGPWACLVSQPFEPPPTGRLWMSVWLRVDDAAAPPALQLALEGRLNDQRYYRHARVGAAPPGRPGVKPIGVGWHRYDFQVNDLPLVGLSKLHVRFDLRGPSEVWIDEVQLYDLAFTENERKELTKLITLANVTLERGRMGDCLRLLEGYWPRFLEEYVPLPPGGVSRSPGPRSIQAAKPQEQPRKTGFLDRVKRFLPIR